MAEGGAPEGGGIKGILGKETAGFPNWVWLLIIGAGVAAAYIIPKFLNKNSTSTSSTGTDTTGSGLGLAIDPTTGLPYAVSGLVPSGAYAGGYYGQTGSSSGGSGSTSGSTGSTSGGSSAPPGGSINFGDGHFINNGTAGPGITIGGGTNGGSGGTNGGSGGSTNASKYINVQAWPNQDGSLSGIAGHYGLTLQRIEQLNPQITNPNLIQPGQQIRIA